MCKICLVCSLLHVHVVKGKENNPLLCLRTCVQYVLFHIHGYTTEEGTVWL